jgi:hypothetical protein
MLQELCQLVFYIGYFASEERVKEQGKGMSVSYVIQLRLQMVNCVTVLRYSRKCNFSYARKKAHCLHRFLRISKMPSNVMRISETEFYPSRVVNVESRDTQIHLHPQVKYGLQCAYVRKTDSGRVNFVDVCWSECFPYEIKNVDHRDNVSGTSINKEGFS